MKVTMIAATQFHGHMASAEVDGKWEPEEPWDEASSLTEFSGRQCYESWAKPNPETATTKGYIRNIIDQNHLSVLEHGTVTFRISDVSRSLTHELVRHRHFSFSQQSQRYVKVSPDHFVTPPMYRDDEYSQEVLREQWAMAVNAYEALTSRWMAISIRNGLDPHRARKTAREAARSVLPNMTPTAIVVSGNHRSWREFLDKRATIHADAEIRGLALEVYDQLARLEPAIYQDFIARSEQGQLVLSRV